MIISCPECEQQVSDKAISCPHCGYPINPMSPTKQLKKSSKRMRLPNGFGRITELKDKKRRKPFRVMVSVGKDEYGRPIGKLLRPEAYFETYNEAYKALTEYNKSPYDFANEITMTELYEKWYDYYSSKVTKSRLYAIKASWLYCEPIIGNRLVQSIRTPDIRRLLDDAYKVNEKGELILPSDNTKKNMKYTLSMMFDYGIEYGYTDRNYVRDIKTGIEDKEAVQPHIGYTKEEISALWSYVGKLWIADMLIVQCYMGWRPNELCNLEISKVNMMDWSITGGSKTKAGQNREAPVHKKIRPIVTEWYHKAIGAGSNVLFFKDKKQPITYEVLKHNYKAMLNAFNGIGDKEKDTIYSTTIEPCSFNMHHRPHDGRKHFITMAKEAGVDEYAIKLIVGHRIMDITERVYTARNIIWLHKELGKIKG